MFAFQMIWLIVVYVVSLDLFGLFICVWFAISSFIVYVIWVYVLLCVFYGLV